MYNYDYTQMLVSKVTHKKRFLTYRNLLPIYWYSPLHVVLYFRERSSYSTANKNTPSLSLLLNSLSSPLENALFMKTYLFIYLYCLLFFWDGLTQKFIFPVIFLEYFYIKSIIIKNYHHNIYTVRDLLKTVFVVCIYISRV